MIRVMETSKVLGIDIRPLGVALAYLSTLIFAPEFSFESQVFQESLPVFQSTVLDVLIPLADDGKLLVVLLGHCRLLSRWTIRLSLDRIGGGI